MGEKVRYGMVGGGEGAFIGAIHRSAAALDNELELVCGAFASDPARSRRWGALLGLDPERCYPDYLTLLTRESARDARERMQFVVVVTPNDLHLPVVRAALEHGFHVLCEKPATLDLEQCRTLAAAVKRSCLLFGLTHPYAAYPVIIEARERIAAGDIGVVRKILVEYTQGWLAEPIERHGNPQALWRLDPARAGASSCMADIGVHAFHLAERVSGLRVREVCAALNRTVQGRLLDDDGAVLLRFDNGAHGVLTASQVCTGDENDLRLRVYGDKGAIEWRQEEPNTLWLKHAHQPAQRLRAGWDYLGAAALRNTRLPSGHPEGYIEAFANLYSAFAAGVRAHAAGESEPAGSLVPGVGEALRGMAFIETVVAASSSDRKWHGFPDLG